MSEYYEDQEVLSAYLLFHYGSAAQVLPWSFGPQESLNFPERIAHLFQEHYPVNPADGGHLRALDIGCAVGRSSFELTRYFNAVVGIDYSQSFIDVAADLAKNKVIDCRYKIQGEQYEDARFSIPADCRPENVRFQQGDAIELERMKLGKFDLILASNILCRLPAPGKFLSEIHQHLRPGGVFVLSTPYSYLEAFTKKELWVGGQKKEKPARASVESLLSQELLMLTETDIPMLIREHERKFQWTVCHVSIWKR